MSRIGAVALGVGAALAVTAGVTALVVSSGDDTADQPDIVPTATGSATSGGAVATAPAAVAMTTQAVVYRTDQAVGGRFQVKITNTGDDDFEVLGVRLESAGFEMMPFTDRVVRYSPGERTDIPTPHGDVRCGRGHPPAPAAVRIKVRTADGVEHEMVSPLESLYESIPKLHTRQCDIALVAAAVDVGLSAIEPVDDGADALLSADISLRRLAGDEPIVVGAVRGSVLYRITPDDSALPLELEPGAARAAIPVTISPARCDGHALGDAKQPFVFPVTIAIGQGDEIGYDIPVPAEQQVLLYDYLTSTCDTAR